jgi:S1-C subfamily serine protease
MKRDSGIRRNDKICFSSFILNPILLNQSLRFGIIFLLLFSFSLNLMAQTEDVNSIISKNFEKSGVEKAKKINNLKITGKIDVMGEFMYFNIYSLKPNKLRLEQWNSTGSSVIIMNDTLGWLIVDDTTHKLNPDAARLSINQYIMIENNLNMMIQRGDTISYIGIDTLDDKTFYKLKSTNLDNVPSYVFINQSDYMIAKVGMLSNIEGQITNNGYNFSNYKNINGVLYPYEVDLITPTLKANIFYDTIVNNIALHDSLFDPKYNQKHNREFLLKRTGAGLIISDEGYILTSNSVISDDCDIEVYFPEANITKIAKIEKRDLENDLAILEIEDFKYNEMYSGEIPYSFADIKDTKPGQEIEILCFEDNKATFLTRLTLKGKIKPMNSNYDPSLFKIDSLENYAKKGSPLFNSEGNLIGMSVAKNKFKDLVSNSGSVEQDVCYSINIDIIKKLIDKISGSDEILERKNVLKELIPSKQIGMIHPFIVQLRIYPKEIK